MLPGMVAGDGDVVWAIPAAAFALATVLKQAIPGRTAMFALKIRWEWCLRYGIAFGFMVGLLLLLAGCVYYAATDVQTTVSLGTRFSQ